MVGSFAAALVGALLSLVAAEAGRAEEASPPPVGLDQLLKLPPPTRAEAGTGPQMYGGASAPEWRARFAEVRAEIEEAEAALQEAQAKLTKMSAQSGQWAMSAPGLGNTKNANPSNSPVSFQLHQELRRQREEIERGERKLQDLKVEASLAGVPEEWTRDPDAPQQKTGTSAADSGTRAAQP